SASPKSSIASTLRTTTNSTSNQQDQCRILAASLCNPLAFASRPTTIYKPPSKQTMRLLRGLRRFAMLPMGIKMIECGGGAWRTTAPADRSDVGVLGARRITLAGAISSPARRHRSGRDRPALRHWQAAEGLRRADAG